MRHRRYTLLTTTKEPLVFLFYLFFLFFNMHSYISLILFNIQKGFGSKWYRRISSAHHSLRAVTITIFNMILYNIGYLCLTNACLFYYVHLGDTLCHIYLTTFANQALCTFSFSFIVTRTSFVSYEEM